MQFRNPPGRSPCTRCANCPIGSIAALLHSIEERIRWTLLRHCFGSIANEIPPAVPWMRIDRSRQRLLSRTTELRFHTRWLQSAVCIARQITTKRQRIKTGSLRAGMPMFTSVHAYRKQATVAQITPPHPIRRIIAGWTTQRLRCTATNACRQIARASRSIEEHTAAAFELLRLTIDAAHKVIAIVVDGQIDETTVGVGGTAKA